MFGKRGENQLAPQQDTAPPAAAPAAAPSPAEPVPPVSQPDASAAPAPVPPQPQPQAQPQKTSPAADPAPQEPEPVSELERARSEEYYDVKTTVFNALIDTIDLTQLARLDAEAAREEIRDIVSEIVAIKNVVMSIAEQEELLEDICNDVLGYGPLEPLLARDEIADIMVNGAEQTFIEVDGKVSKASVRFADNAQLMNICQRIVSQVGRRVDESSPICDARLMDGSRVNVIAPPLAIDGPTLTIRKFKRDRLTLDQLVNFGSISQEGRTLLGIIGKVRCNTVISGGTGSGKTTLLNCLTGNIERDERIITCEDSAELQLQQPHVVRLETRPPNLEGEGEVTMRDLVKNCLRMRPDRIIVGEVRGPEAFDLLQAMNTGHDGSMGTLHSNSPRECLSRLESMILMGGFNLPAKTIREMIVASIDIIVQASRLRDGSRKITHVTEVVGIEGEVVTLQDIFVYEMQGEDSNGRILGQHRATGIARPRFWDRACYYGEEQRLAEALSAAEVKDASGNHWVKALLDPQIVQISIVVLAALAVGGMVYVVVTPFLSDERKAGKRMAAVKQGRAAKAVRSGASEVMNTRKKQVQETIKALEAKKKSAKKVTMATRLSRAGLDVPARSFYIASLVSGLVVGCVVLITGSSPLVSLGSLFVGGIGFPRWLLSYMAKRRQTRFTKEFANAIDVIVRGVKSGLPLNDCLQIIAKETPEPVRGEFQDLVEQQQIGVPLTKAFDRMLERMPLQEVNFFAIVVAIQSQTGGNLAEALSNLSAVLRGRQQLQSKVATFSAEAKASAAIIGSLPPGVMMMVYMARPDYISLLWTEPLGKVMLVGSVLWMLTGVLVMRKMINFDY